MPIYWTFSEILRIKKKLGPEQVKKVRFRIGFWCIPRFRGNFGPPAAKKAKTKRFYTPPLGGKKTTEFVSPQKESFGKSKGVWVDFVFKVGGKIGWVDFCVQSRSQSRFVTILNPYMGGGRLLTNFPPSPHAQTHAQTDAQPDAQPHAQTDV